VQPGHGSKGEPRGTILGVWAHPDDETYLSAGLMATAVREGRRVVCVTATRGEAGSQDEERWPLVDLPAIREIELMNALDALGVSEHAWLDYRDGECASVPREEAVEKVAALIADVRPDSVLTFGPDGMTGHPDHIAVCDWTTEAFARAAPAGAKLFYATMTPEMADILEPAFEPYNVFFAGPPPRTPREQLGIDFHLSPELLELKFEAIRAQVSQSEGLLDAFGREFFDVSNREETFALAQERASA
jgi:LmbE family N-acetylglucosaminyl deacetylase